MNSPLLGHDQAIISSLIDRIGTTASHLRQRTRRNKKSFDFHIAHKTYSKDRIPITALFIR